VPTAWVTVQMVKPAGSSFGVTSSQASGVATAAPGRAWAVGSNRRVADRVAQPVHQSARTANAGHDRDIVEQAVEDGGEVIHAGVAPSARLRSPPRNKALELTFGPPKAPPPGEDAPRKHLDFSRLSLAGTEFLEKKSSIRARSHGAGLAARKFGGRKVSPGCKYCAYN
jgi:hypothetical protein